MVTDGTIIPNHTDPSKPFTIIQIHNSMKLSQTNYIAWKTQIQATLLGYDMWKFVDGSFSSPPTSLPNADGTSVANPTALTWFCQDWSIFGVIVGTLSQDIVPLVSQTVSQTGTAEKAWKVLAITYANPLRGHFKQIKSNLSQITHST